MVKRNKYNAGATKKYDSTSEEARAKVLAEWNRYGIIADLREQVRYSIAPPNCEPIFYTPDFTYTDVRGIMPGSHPGCQIAEDVKGFITSEFILRAKLFRALYPGTKLMLSRARWKQVKKVKYINEFQYLNFDTRRGKKWQTLQRELTMRSTARRTTTRVKSKR